MALTEEKPQVVVNEVKKGKFELEVRGFDRNSQTFQDSVSSELQQAYRTLDSAPPENRSRVTKFLDKLTFHKPKMDGKLDSNEQLNALALFINAEASSAKPERRIQIYKAMGKVLENIDYNDPKQVENTGKMLANNNKWRDSSIIGAALSKMDNPEHVAKLLVAMGQDKHGNYRGTSVLAYVLNGKNFSQEPETAVNKPALVSPEKQIENRKFVQDVLAAVEKQLESPVKMAKFLEAKKGGGAWEIGKRGSTFSDFEDASKTLRASVEARIRTPDGS